MALRAKYEIDDKQVSEMDLSITLSMPVDSWRRLVEKLDHTWPACDVKSAIRGALENIGRATARKYYLPEEPT